MPRRCRLRWRCHASDAQQEALGRYLRPGASSFLGRGLVCGGGWLHLSGRPVPLWRRRASRAPSSSRSTRGLGIYGLWRYGGY